MLRGSAPKHSDTRRCRQVVSLPLQEIRPNPRQPRRRFDPQAIAELADSIQKMGLLQPIMVRAIPVNGYELIAGERRLRACQRLGLTHIDAIVLPARAQDSALLALIENLQREDLHYLEEAAGYAAVLQQRELTQEELAARIGRSPSAVANKLRLLRLEEPVRVLLRDADLTERHARALLRLPEGPQRLHAAEQMQRDDMNVRQAEAFVAGLLRATTPAGEAPRGRRVITLMRDHRLYINAIRDIVTKMRQIGVEARVDVSELSDCVEVRVVMPRKKALAGLQACANRCMIQTDDPPPTARRDTDDADSGNPREGEPVPVRTMRRHHDV